MSRKPAGEIVLVEMARPIAQYRVAIQPILIVEPRSTVRDFAPPQGRDPLRERGPYRGFKIVCVDWSIEAAGRGKIHETDQQPGIERLDRQTRRVLDEWHAIERLHSEDMVVISPHRFDRNRHADGPADLGRPTAGGVDHGIRCDGVAGFQFNSTGPRR
jgi:hypothetical protein